MVGGCRWVCRLETRKQSASVLGPLSPCVQSCEELFSLPIIDASFPSFDASFPSPDTSFPSLDTSFRSSRRLVPKSRQLSWRAREVRRRHMTPFAVNTMHTGMEVIDVVKGGRCVYLSKTCKNNPSRPRAVRGVEMVRRMGRGGGASAFFVLFFVN